MSSEVKVKVSLESGIQPGLTKVKAQLRNAVVCMNCTVLGTKSAVEGANA